MAAIGFSDLVLCNQNKTPLCSQVAILAQLGLGGPHGYSLLRLVLIGHGHHQILFVGDCQQESRLVGSKRRSWIILIILED